MFLSTPPKSAKRFLAACIQPCSFTSKNRSSRRSVNSRTVAVDSSNANHHGIRLRRRAPALSMISLTRPNTAMAVPMRYVTNICGVVVFLLLLIGFSWSSGRQFLYDNGVLHADGLRNERVRPLPQNSITSTPAEVVPETIACRLEDVQNATLGVGYLS